ncbi:MAG: DUF1553 domain-containing protein, partial [Armatimonadaceae bacterium]
ALYGIFQSTRFSYPGCEPFQQPKLLVPLASEAEQKVRDAAINEIEIQLTKSTREAIPSSAVTLGGGRVPDAGAADIQHPNIDVQTGDVLIFEVHPNANHGADTTKLDLRISGLGAGDSVLGDVLDALPGDAPAIGPWMFVDLSDGIRPLGERLMQIDGKASLRGWRRGDTPSVFGNNAMTSVDVWTKLPARSVFVHPGPKGPVGILWTATTTGKITVSGRIADAHPGGDGVSWQLRKIPGGAPIVKSVKDRFTQDAVLLRKLENLKQQRTIDIAFACTEGTGADARVQIKGDPAVPGAVVERGAPSFLGFPGGKVTTGSGRLELAKWITSRRNPLTARVWVNRIWQGHFGSGIVETPNDFGLRGAAPGNQPLLDWLATTFMENGWDTKRLHKLLMTSDAYQRKSGSGTRASLLASFPRRRLTAEELRDTYLMVSGMLDLSPGGAHPFPPEQTWAFTQHTPFADDYETAKRSVYVMQKRNRRSSFFALFDGPDPNTSTALRDKTTVPTQALWLMNSAFVHSTGAALAVRTQSGSGDVDMWMTALYRTLLGRHPTADERSSYYSLEYELYDGKSGVTPRAWNAYVKALLVSNEVLYVD